MTQKDIISTIQTAKEQFANYNGEFGSVVKNTEIVLCSRKTMDRLRSEAFVRAGETEYEYSSGTSGETIAGNGFIVVLLYQFALHYPSQVEDVLWHELGHCVDNQYHAELRNEIESYFDNKNTLFEGYSIWSEFVAEAICNMVGQREPVQILWDKQNQLFQLLKESFPGNTVFPYKLAHYLAMCQTDTSIEYMYDCNHDINIGLSIISEEQADIVMKMLLLMDKQLCEDKFWIITNDRLRELGELFDELWSITWNS